MTTGLINFSLFYIALGGGIGAVLRHIVHTIGNTAVFPYGTVAINISGSVLMGIFAAWLLSASGQNISESTRLFLATGILGGFTTFSTFSLESMKMLQNGQTTQAVFYILLSVFGAIAGVCLGYALFRMIG